MPIIDWLKARARKLWHWITGRKPVVNPALQARLKARKSGA